MPRTVAIFGTFDVENYGDLLFPLVAAARLAPHGIAPVAVSPTGRRAGYDDAPRPEAQAGFRPREGLAAVLVGGGNIVHALDFGLPGYGPRAYRDLWAGATEMAARTGLPVAWNSPGVLAPDGAGTGPPADWVRRTADAAARLAVRDAGSADAFEKWAGIRPQVMPDTALDLPLVWPAARLAARWEAIRGRLGLVGDGPIVAVHAKERSLHGTNATSFAVALDAALAASGARAILLALGRCHGDHHTVRAIHAAAPLRTIPFDDPPALEDIAAAIASSSAVLTSSLHGHITAAAYGVPARLVAVPYLHKFEGQAGQMGRRDEVVGSWGRALEALPGLLGEKGRGPPRAAREKLDAHWEQVVRLAGGSPAAGGSELAGHAAGGDASAQGASFPALGAIAADSGLFLPLLVLLAQCLAAAAVLRRKASNRPEAFRALLALAVVIAAGTLVPLAGQVGGAAG
ncbi:polysaccharide pyruvyl transferase-domain-containing protein [Hyaloraphidium curvatum]|nr:polysaccharide pyruvyl transferase-domain-containing protein [Hyaloraphidium curvatum]